MLRFIFQYSFFSYYVLEWSFLFSFRIRNRFFPICLSLLYSCNLLGNTFITKKKMHLQRYKQDSKPTVWINYMNGKLNATTVDNKNKCIYCLIIYLASEVVWCISYFFSFYETRIYINEWSYLENQVLKLSLYIQISYFHLKFINLSKLNLTIKYLSKQKVIWFGEVFDKTKGKK